MNLVQKTYRIQISLKETKTRRKGASSGAKREDNIENINTRKRLVEAGKSHSRTILKPILENN